MLSLKAPGFFCEHGGFFVDPWLPVARAVVTHAHGDHLVAGCGAYLVARDGERVCRERLGTEAAIQAVDYGEPVNIDGVDVSLYPAGHILGSAQVRLERGGQIWVFSGDYKIAADATCTPFEAVRCHTFVTEATFGLPIYRWPPSEEVFAAIEGWWRANRDVGRASVLFAYALGKAQRVLSGIDATIGPIFTHGAVERMNRAYRESGIRLPATTHATAASAAGKVDGSGALIFAPESARGTPWLNRLGAHASGLVSGWMRIRGARRRRAVDRGFVLSDHVDWPALMQAIDATGAERIGVTHGYVAEVVRWLHEQGIDAKGYETRYEGEIADATAITESSTE